MIAASPPTAWSTQRVQSQLAAPPRGVGRADDRVRRRRAVRRARPQLEPPPAAHRGRRAPGAPLRQRAEAPAELAAAGARSEWDELIRVDVARTPVAALLEQVDEQRRLGADELGVARVARAEASALPRGCS